MATFRNGCGCTITGDLQLEEINTERMGDGWQEVTAEDILMDIQFTREEQAELNLSKVARRQK